MLKVGLVGCGGISGGHVPVWDEMEDAELVAICDIRPKQMERYPGHKNYTDFDKMLEENEFDIIDITLPTFLHAEFAIKALNHGINVLSEKPCSLFEDDVNAIYDAAEKNGVKYMVAQVLRFWGEYEIVKQLYDTKQYGNLISGSMWRIGTYPGGGWNNWYHDKKLSGLVPFDLHIHDADFLVYAFGAPGKMECRRRERPDQDYLSAVYDYGDFSVTVEAAWYKADYPFYMGFRFQFEEAVVEMARDGFTIYDCKGNRLHPCEAGAENKSDFELPSSNAYANEIHYFAGCVKNNTPVTKVTRESILTVLRLLNRMK